MAAERNNQNVFETPPSSPLFVTPESTPRGNRQLTVVEEPSTPRANVNSVPRPPPPSPSTPRSNRPRIPINERALASHPKFISFMYQFVKNAEMDIVQDGGLPDHTLTVIGGAAFTLYAYVLHNHNMEEMEQSLANANIEKTADIDLSLWYHQELSRADFLEYNRKFKNRIEQIFTSDETKQQIKRLFDRFIPNHEKIATFDVEVTIEKIPERFHNKLFVYDVGPDRWFNSLHPELIEILEELVDMSIKQGKLIVK